ncbi:hypothetical protein L6303_06870 [archaeon]|nr:hypothetical protein [Nanoarchaeota archaeon]MBU4300184.1 hypothetical protein [Nanoarchaeota archaeon]MBU4452058.1 hypothetical protein [Nanoarchaeota archaeon]MCG2724439.1 hypothetical protein [archaeon]
MILIIDILTLVTSTLGSVLNVMFAANLLAFGIITGILARVLGSDMFSGFKAGAINYLIMKLGIAILLAFLGAINSWVVLGINFGLSAYIIMSFTRLDAIRSIAIAVASNYLTPLFFSIMFSMIR